MNCPRWIFLVEFFSFLYKFEERRKNGSLLKACKELDLGSHSQKKCIYLQMRYFASSLWYQHQWAIKRLSSIAIQKLYMENTVPNVVIAFRIMLTAPVSVAWIELNYLTIISVKKRGCKCNSIWRCHRRKKKHENKID